MLFFFFPVFVYDGITTNEGNHPVNYFTICYGGFFMKKDYPKIFEPFTVRRMTIRNRIVMTPMGTNYGETDGQMSLWHLNYYICVFDDDESGAAPGTQIVVVEMP